MNETGAVKFRFEIVRRELGPFVGFGDLNAARQRLKRLGLVGVDANGVGFGNISLRDGKSRSFYITGTGTGGRVELGPKDYAKVVSWNFTRNWLRCEGCIIASTESLTHAAIYAADAEVGAVIHGHEHELWLDLIRQGAATNADVSYGTPEMAKEVQRLFRETNVRARKIFAMAGHTDGIVVFGSDLEEALRTVTVELGRTRPEL